MTILRFFSVFFLLASCNQLQEPASESIPTSSDVQTISLLGDSLRSSSNPLPQNLSSRIDSLIQVASVNGDTVGVAIWEARRLGYEGKYREAIDLLNQSFTGVSETEIPQVLRHMGHRYISLRAFDHAIPAFLHASDFIKGKEDIVEQDGLPNAQNKPTSTLHTNIWYHLGLAYYLTGEYKKAQYAYEQCIKASTNDDMLVAALYWYYMALKRNGQDELAGKVLKDVHSEMDIIENDSYLKLLLVFKAEFDPQLLLDENSDALSNATIGYGIGNWHFMNGRKDRAESIWRQVYEGSDSWASFGFVASEAELARSDE